MNSAAKIPVSVIVMTLNEEQKIGACLSALQQFDEIFVVDSNSTDQTASIAQEMGASVIPFTWNGAYPKKKQWAIDNCPMTHDFVFLVDADEVVSKDLVEEIRGLDFKVSGYFIRSLYVMNGRPLKYGAQNKKLCLFNRHRMAFPEIDDLGQGCLGEVEGHYQPVFKDISPPSSSTSSPPRATASQESGDPEKTKRGAFRHMDSTILNFASLSMRNDENKKLKTLKSTYLHDCLDDEAAWLKKHQRYAAWEREMNKRKAWPVDPNPLRQSLKQLFRAMPCRGLIAFAHSYIWNLGFLDGARGLKFANLRRRYYKMIE